MTEIISLAATMAFAVTAVLAVKKDKDIDLVGATILGLITAVGGGTIRDLILDVPIFWSQDLSYVWVALASSVAAFFSRKLLAGRHVSLLMLYLDGFGVSLFGILATGKVWDLGFGLPVAPVLLAVVTAIGGGLVRDVLAGRTTLLMTPELYATPVLVGCSLFALVLTYLPAYRYAASLICILLIFAGRSAAIHWNLGMPHFLRFVHEKDS
ncbi:MAG: TRIC cation channel family protein [Deltaproteobacteria bacterium]|nr:TRIC cation channel family protein [Deltaproteobacteria bacterium]